MNLINKKSLASITLDDKNDLIMAGRAQRESLRYELRDYVDTKEYAANLHESYISELYKMHDKNCLKNENLTSLDLEYNYIADQEVTLTLAQKHLTEKKQLLDWLEFAKPYTDMELIELSILGQKLSDFMAGLP